MRSIGPVILRLLGVGGAALMLLFTLQSLHAQQDVIGQILERINRARQEAGLGPLTRNPQLDAAAQSHADDMSQNGTRLGHRGSDGSRMQQRIARAGYPSANVGENWGAYRSLDQIFEFWLSDSAHRQNILASKFTEIGIGVAQRANSSLIVVTDFGGPGAAPAAQPAAIQPEPTQPPPTELPAPTDPPEPTAAPPTPLPTGKPKLAPTVTPTAPPAEPTQIVQVALAQPARPLHARAGVGRALLIARADGQSSAARAETLFTQFNMGAALALGGGLLLGVAVVGHSGRRTHRRRRR